MVLPTDVQLYNYLMQIFLQMVRKNACNDGKINVAEAVI